MAQEDQIQDKSKPQLSPEEIALIKYRAKPWFIGGLIAVCVIVALCVWFTFRYYPGHSRATVNDLIGMLGDILRVLLGR